MTARSSFPMSPLQTLLVWVLVASVAAGVWYAVFYTTAEEEWQSASNELAAAHSDLQTRHARRDEVRRYAIQQDRDEAALAAELAGIPGGDGRSEDALLLELPALAEASGLVIDRWRPRAEEVEPSESARAAGPELMWAPVEVEARGSWAALHAFLGRVGELPQVVAVDLREVRASSVDDTLVWRLVVSVARLAPREGTQPVGAVQPGGREWRSGSEGSEALRTGALKPESRSATSPEGA